MGTERFVELRWEVRTVVVDCGGTFEVVDYLGFTLIHRDAESVVSVTWLPVGEEPTFADDEALIQALRKSWHWALEGI